MIKQEKKQKKPKSPIGITNIKDRTHGRNPKTGRSYIGEEIDRQKPILFR